MSYPLARSVLVAGCALVGMGVLPLGSFTATAHALAATTPPSFASQPVPSAAVRLPGAIEVRRE